MRTNRTITRAAGLGGAIALLAAGVAATQATGQTESPPSRSAAILAATQAELADTQHRVGTIRLEHVIDGREVYALSGADSSCILVAGVEQPDGRSQSLACTHSGPAETDGPMRTGYATAAGAGYVDLVWVGGAAPSQVATEGAAADVRIGTDVLAVVRTDDAQASGLRWQAPAGGSVSVPLPSRVERNALARGER